MKRLALLLLTAGLAATTFAQSASNEAPSAAPSDAPAVAIFANVHARELRFDDQPRVHVEVTGGVNGKPAAVVSRTDRQNLPDPVQPHVTYRDIGIQLTITSTLPDIETILDEALAPAQPQPAAPPAAASPKPPARPRSNGHRPRSGK